MFAYGVIAMETLSGRPPMPSSQIVMIGSGYAGSYVVVPETVRRREDLRHLSRNHVLYPVIVRCLKEASQRPTAADMMDTFRLIAARQAQLSRHVLEDLSLQGWSDCIQGDDHSRLTLLEGICQLDELQQRREQQEKEGESAMLKASVRHEVQEMSYNCHLSRAQCGRVAVLHGQVCFYLFSR